MLKPSDYLALDAVALSHGIRNKDFSCSEVTEAAIARAKEVNPTINAIVFENYSEALKAAANFDKNPDLLRGSNVAGLPFLIKDLSTVEGLPAEFGSRLFDGNIAEKNSRIVQRYLDAGLIVLGKTNTPEFGLTITTEPRAAGPCRNPWNIDYSTGGSSGGAAAAVAAGIIPVAHATDGGGSIRIPAACCGVFGLKPSRGLTTIEDKFADSWSGMSVGHVVSQTVRDSAAFLDLISIDRANLFPLPPAPKSFFDEHLDSPGKLRIALQLNHPQSESIDPECTAAVRKAAELCEQLGHVVEEVAHPVDYRPVISAMSKIINLHVFQTVQPQLDALGVSVEDSQLEASTKIMASNGRDTSAASYIAAIDLVKSAERQLARFHGEYDVIISPVLTKTPAKLGWLDMDSNDMREYSARFKAYSGFTALYNGTGQPSLSLPLGRTSADVPVGVMFTGAWGEDLQLLQLATQLEAAAPWEKHASAL